MDIIAAYYPFYRIKAQALSAFFNFIKSSFDSRLSKPMRLSDTAEDLQGKKSYSLEHFGKRGGR